MGLSEGHGEVVFVVPQDTSRGTCFVYGAQLFAPLNDWVAIFGAANFVTPADTGTVDAYLGFEIYPGGGAKEVFVQDYQFAKPMHGYSGHSGNYYCDYQRLPNRVCVTNSNGTESCKIVGWTLREMCQ